MQAWHETFRRQDFLETNAVPTTYRPQTSFISSQVASQVPWLVLWRVLAHLVLVQI